MSNKALEAFNQASGSSGTGLYQIFVYGTFSFLFLIIAWITIQNYKEFSAGDLSILGFFLYFIRNVALFIVLAYFTYNGK